MNYAGVRGIAGSITPAQPAWEASSPGCWALSPRAPGRQRSPGCCSSQPSGWVSTPGPGSRPRSQSSRRLFGVRGAASPRAAPGRGLAVVPFVAVAGAWGRRVSRDCADGRRIRDRDEDQTLRRPPSGSGARAGGVAVAAPAKVGTRRRSGRDVRRSRTRRRAGRPRGSGGFGRPVDARPSRCSAHGSRPAFQQVRRSLRRSSVGLCGNPIAPSWSP